MTQAENVQEQWEILLERVQDFIKAMVELCNTIAEILMPSLKRAIKDLRLFIRRRGFYYFLYPYFGVKVAWWVSTRLPDWMVLRLLQKWVQLL